MAWRPAIMEVCKDRSGVLLPTLNWDVQIEDEYEYEDEDKDPVNVREAKRLDEHVFEAQEIGRHKKLKSRYTGRSRRGSCWVYIRVCHEIDW